MPLRMLPQIIVLLLVFVVLMSHQGWCADTESGSSVAQSTAGTFPRNEYCDQLEKLIFGNWTDNTVFSTPVEFRFNVNEVGKVSEIKPHKKWKKTSAEAEGTKMIESLGALPVPPSSISQPLQIAVTFANEPDKRSISTQPNFKQYMGKLQRRIKSGWYPPRAPESQRAVIFFKIWRDGNVTELRIKKSSGNVETDQAALRAAKSRSPFAPLPDGSSRFVEIEFTFDYNNFQYH